MHVRSRPRLRPSGGDRSTLGTVPSPLIEAQIEQVPTDATASRSSDTPLADRIASAWSALGWLGFASPQTADGAAAPASHKAPVASTRPQAAREAAVAASPPRTRIGGPAAGRHHPPLPMRRAGQPQSPPPPPPPPQPQPSAPLSQQSLPQPPPQLQPQQSQPQQQPVASSQHVRANRGTVAPPVASTGPSGATDAPPRSQTLPTGRPLPAATSAQMSTGAAAAASSASCAVAPRPAWPAPSSTAHPSGRGLGSLSRGMRPWSEAFNDHTHTRSPIRERAREALRHSVRDTLHAHDASPLTIHTPYPASKLGMATTGAYEAKMGLRSGLPGYSSKMELGARQRSEVARGATPAHACGGDAPARPSAESATRLDEAFAEEQYRRLLQRVGGVEWAADAPDAGEAVAGGGKVASVAKCGCSATGGSANSCSCRCNAQPSSARVSSGTAAAPVTASKPTAGLGAAAAAEPLVATTAATAPASKPAATNAAANAIAKVTGAATGAATTPPMTSKPAQASAAAAPAPEAAAQPSTAPGAAMPMIASGLPVRSPAPNQSQPLYSPAAAPPASTAPPSAAMHAIARGGGGSKSIARGARAAEGSSMAIGRSLPTRVNAVGSSGGHAMGRGGVRSDAAAEKETARQAESAQAAAKAAKAAAARAASAEAEALARAAVAAEEARVAAAEAEAASAQAASAAAAAQAVATGRSSGGGSCARAVDGGTASSGAGSSGASACKRAAARAVSAVGSRPSSTSNGSAASGASAGPPPPATGLASRHCAGGGSGSAHGVSGAASSQAACASRTHATSAQASHEAPSQVGQPLGAAQAAPVQQQSSSSHPQKAPAPPAREESRGHGNCSGGGSAGGARSSTPIGSAGGHPMRAASGGARGGGASGGGASGGGASGGASGRAGGAVAGAQVLSDEVCKATVPSDMSSKGACEANSKDVCDGSTKPACEPNGRAACEATKAVAQRVSVAPLRPAGAASTASSASSLQRTPGGGIKTLFDRGPAHPGASGQPVRSHINSCTSHQAPDVSTGTVRSIAGRLSAAAGSKPLSEMRLQSGGPSIDEVQKLSGSHLADNTTWTSGSSSVSVGSIAPAEAAPLAPRSFIECNGTAGSAGAVSPAIKSTDGAAYTSKTPRPSSVPACASTPPSSVPASASTPPSAPPPPVKSVVANHSPSRPGSRPAFTPPPHRTPSPPPCASNRNRPNSQLSSTGTCSSVSQPSNRPGGTTSQCTTRLNTSPPQCSNRPSTAQCSTRAGASPPQPSNRACSALAQSSTRLNASPPQHSNRPAALQSATGQSRLTTGVSRAGQAPATPPLRSIGRSNTTAPPSAPLSKRGTIAPSAPPSRRAALAQAAPIATTSTNGSTTGPAMASTTSSSKAVQPSDRGSSKRLAGHGCAGGMAKGLASGSTSAPAASISQSTSGVKTNVNEPAQRKGLRGGTELAADATHSASTHQMLPNSTSGSTIAPSLQSSVVRAVPLAEVGNLESAQYNLRAELRSRTFGMQYFDEALAQCFEDDPYPHPASRAALSCGGSGDLVGGPLTDSLTSGWGSSESASAIGGVRAVPGSHTRGHQAPRSRKQLRASGSSGVSVSAETPSPNRCKGHSLVLQRPERAKRRSSTDGTRELHALMAAEPARSKAKRQTVQGVRTTAYGYADAAVLDRKNEMSSDFDENAEGYTSASLVMHSPRHLAGEAMAQEAVDGTGFIIDIRKTFTSVLHGSSAWHERDLGPVTPTASSTPAERLRAPSSEDSQDWIHWGAFDEVQSDFQSTRRTAPSEMCSGSGTMSSDSHSSYAPSLSDGSLADVSLGSETESVASSRAQVDEMSDAEVRAYAKRLQRQIASTSAAPPIATRRSTWLKPNRLAIRRQGGPRRNRDGLARKLAPPSRTPGSFAAGVRLEHIPADGSTPSTALTLDSACPTAAPSAAPSVRSSVPTCRCSLSCVQSANAGQTEGWTPRPGAEQGSTALKSSLGSGLAPGAGGIARARNVATEDSGLNLMSRPLETIYETEEEEQPEEE